MIIYVENKKKTIKLNKIRVHKFKNDKEYFRMSNGET